MHPRENRYEKKRLKLGKYTRGETYLAKQLRAYGVEPPVWQPIGNICLIWRFPPIEWSSGKHGAPLIIPEDSQSPNAKGLLVAAGPLAMDFLKSHGLKLGDAVVFTRFGGDESNDSTRTRELGQRFLTLKSSDILGSVELRTDLEKGRYRYIEGTDGKLKLEQRAPRKALPAMSRTKGKVLALAASPGATPAERDTARRIAAKMK
jgi:co-chaperonin GroES (HSP10)